MAKAKVYGAVSRASKGRLKPTDKHGKESWKRRNAARKGKQEAFAADVAAIAALADEHAAQVAMAEADAAEAGEEARAAR